MKVFEGESMKTQIFFHGHKNELNALKKNIKIVTLSTKLEDEKQLKL